MCFPSGLQVGQRWREFERAGFAVAFWMGIFTESEEARF